MTKISHPPIESVLDQAIADHQAGRLEQAEVHYRTALEKTPDDAAANYNFAVLALQRGRPDLGLAHFKAAAEATTPSRGHYLLAYGQALVAAGQLQEAVVVFRRALEYNPKFAEAHLNLGNMFQRQGALEAAAHCYREALLSKPDFPEAHYGLANALKASGALSEAVVSYRKAIALKPDFAAAYYHLGNALRASGAPLGEAQAAFAQALTLRPDFVEAHNNLGMLLFQEGAFNRAAESFRRALALRPDYGEAHNNLGNAFKATGDLTAAEAAYRQALAVRPDFAEAISNLGVVLYEQGNVEEAVASYRRALALRPDYAEAHHNLANALARDGETRDEAIESYRQAIALMPEYIDAYHHLGVALCENHRIAEGFEWFTRGAKLATAGYADAVVAPHKVRHDREQHAYLAGVMPGSGACSDSLHIVHGARLATPAINLHQAVGEIEHLWRCKQPQIAVIDNLLTAEALEALRRFCWGSTIWREVFDDGYLGARPESGFACPLLAQITEELRSAYPAIFRDHPLLYSWAFKYDNALKGTKIHADFAAVNVNFWITPDEANLNSESGGLVVWDVAAPLDWDFKKYNADEPVIRDFLARNGAHSTTIPYRANRAVIFDSDLFHETDCMEFKDGYQNRRINITLLYGRRTFGEK